MAGEGGDDAKKFAEQLFLAYLAYLDRNQLHGELEETGPGKWSFTCVDKRAIDLFDQETGGHCVQRVPPNEKSGRRHTSYVAVTVTLLRPQKEMTMRECDLQESFQRGSQGAGGQNANKVNSAVRLRHIPTGLEVFINGRDQWANRRTAREALAGKVAQWHKGQQTRASYSGAGRGDKVRSYNLIDNRITDHRTGAKVHRPENILKEGRFELLR